MGKEKKDNLKDRNKWKTEKNNLSEMKSWYQSWVSYYAQAAYNHLLNNQNLLEKKMSFLLSFILQTHQPNFTKPSLTS